MVIYNIVSNKFYKGIYIRSIKINIMKIVLFNINLIGFEIGGIRLNKGIERVLSQ
jgi:hypothetical protein